MFEPKYTITAQLLANIKRIGLLVQDLNHTRLGPVVLLELETSAYALSTHASTSIEGNPLPLTEVKKLLKSGPTNVRDSEREVLNYNQALQSLNAKLNDESLHLSLKLVLSVQQQVTSGLLPPSDSGHFRQVPIVVQDPRTGQPVYLPPEIPDVTVLMDQLIGFVNSQVNKIDPLILAGIFHKQMVIIHPFVDGNGRTTRLVTKGILAGMGLNTFNLFSFENYYNQNVTKYFQMVGEFGNYYELINQIDFTQWLEYFTGGIIDELLRVQASLPKNPTTFENRLHPYHSSILNYIAEHGLITDQDYSRLSSRAKSTRVQDFKKLIALGLIERRGRGRTTHYVAKTD